MPTAPSSTAAMTPGPTSQAGRGSPRPVVRWLAPVLLGTVTAAAYLNADHDEFLFDSAAISDDPVNRDLGLSLRLLFRSPLAIDGRLAHLTFAINHALNRALGLPGFDVTGFLVFNAVVHAVNAWLGYLLVGAFLRTIGAPAGAGLPLVMALWFAVHPLHASSVAYILQRRGSLALTFCLLAVLAWLHARPGGLLAGRPAWRRAAMAVVAAACCVPAYRCKSIALALPLVIVAMELCLRAPDPAALRRLALAAAFIVAAVSAGMLWWVWRRGLLDFNALEFRFAGARPLWSMTAHVLTECRVFWHYWKLLLLPWPGWMSIDHDFAVSRTLGEHSAWLAAAGHVALLAGAGWLARRGRVLVAAGICWFYLTLLPYAIMPQAELMVEYKTYLPSMGLVLVLAGLLAPGWPRWPRAARIGLPAMVAALLFTITVQRNAIYQSSLNLWTDARAKSPGRARVHLNLGNALLNLGRGDEATRCFEEALRLLPEYTPAIVNLGNQLAAAGRLEAAEARYREALGIDPTYAHAHNNLATCLERQGRVGEAVGHYEEALRLRPNFFDARYNLSRALAGLGRQQEAVEGLSQAVRLKPEAVESRVALARLLSGAGRHVEAAEQYAAVVELRPDLAEARLDLGNCLIDAGRYEEAASALEEAVRLAPRHAEARNCLGTALLALGQAGAAAEAFEAALGIAPEHIHARLNLGLALEAAGRMEEARRTYEDVLRRVPGQPIAVQRLAVVTSAPASGPSSP